MSAEERLDFLIFITDQFNPRCLGYAGHPLVCTPHLDQLAADGMIFSRMYTSQPLCMPARATLFTGLTPRGHRVRMNGIPLDPAIPTFTEALRLTGYRTHCCGKTHLNCGAPPKDFLLEDMDPSIHLECQPLWMNGSISDLPHHYYGLENVDFVNGHGYFSYGHYLHWLENEHPKEAKLFYNAVPLEEPSQAFNLFNRNSFKWALPKELHPMTWIADRSIDFLEQAGMDRREGDNRPFMLMCSFQEPHPPFAPPAPYCYAYAPEDVPPPLGRAGEYDDLPPHFRQMYETAIRTSGNHSQPMSATTPYYGECAAHYFGLIEMLDEQVGRVVESLSANGLMENTVILFISDHGEALGDHGLWGKGPYHYDSVIRVPFLVVWPGKINPGSVYEGVTSLLDFAPTILDIADVPIPQGLIPATPEAPNAPPPWPGKSLLPVLLDQDPCTEQNALIEMDEDYLGFKMRTIVNRRFRMTVYSDKQYGELFDFREDPFEEHNCWNDPRYQSIKKDLHLELLHKIINTDISLSRQLSRA